MGIQGWQWLIMIPTVVGAVGLVIGIAIIIATRNKEPVGAVTTSPGKPVGHTADGQPLYRSTQPQPTNTFAILSLIFSFFIGVMGVVFGHLARAQIRRTGEAGDGLALAGLVIGYAAILAWGAAALVMFASMPMGM
ncbi:DUF4190 domain-containing protein [Zhihengliuella salsuginis]|uniref:DUF4190 domain-containing protein n=1 Tax=Zhihengliuella salsuginis TaxID=578222 RepID=A0ABQ3GIL5_9MICC|nr:DUF4190 domain-containing protein [Zhihengliuella salsuginis]GHD06003.1 hypothetical protein GCM10008096_15480 [Zhihengliuella salsuginis]